jgi:hypothetical protein
VEESPLLRACAEDCADFGRIVGRRRWHAACSRLDIMSISERVTRSLSTLLIAAVAATTVGWTAAGWAGSPCSPQEHSCTPQASLTCCHSSPDPFDAARQPNVAPPPGSSSHGSLMDLESPLTGPGCGHTTSRHPLQRLDLNILHQTLLI